MADSGGVGATEQSLDLEAIFASLPALLFVIGPDDAFVGYRAGREPLLMPPEAFLGRPVEAVLPAPVGAAMKQALARCRKAAEAVLLDYALSLPDGQRAYEARLVPLTGSRVAVLVTDVTPQREAERRLRESEERFRALIERSLDLVMVADADGRVTFASAASADLLGIPPAELIGTSGFDHVHPGDLGKARALLESARSSAGATVSDELRGRHRDGSWRLFSVEVRDLRGVPGVGGLVVSARDITEQRRLQEQYFQSQKLESVGRLAGGVAHDFNNLLTGILGFAEFLEQGIRAGNASLQDLAELKRAAVRARDLTRQLLAVARRQVSQPRPLDLNEVVRESERLLRRVLGEDIDLAVRLGEGLGAVLADPSQVEQVMLNLAVNARDAMPRGGKLTLETANSDLDEAAAAARPGARPGRYVLLAVSDSGQGLSPEAQAHLFEPFFTTKPVGQGTGLGLATVYGIVKQAGGYVSAYSESGRGTTFKIWLPRTDAVPGRVSPPAAAALRGGSETVLLVEDDESVREVAVRALSTAGYRVLAATSGTGALQLAATAPPLHLLITDVVMPGMSGPEAAAALSALRPGLKVLYVSGYTRNAIAHHGVLDAGVHFLAKPFSPGALLAAVREVLDAP